MSNHSYPGLGTYTGTLMLVSEFPNLDMPAVKVNDTGLVDPTDSKCLLDGEWVYVKTGTLYGGASEYGSRVAQAIASANIPTISNAAGDDNASITQYLDSSTVIRPANQFRLKHGNPGRPDNQAAGNISTIKDNSNFEYYYRLTHTGAAYNVGEPLFVWEIPYADLPAQTQSYVVGSRAVMGLVPLNWITAQLDAGANGSSLQAVGFVEGGASDGWIHVSNGVEQHVFSGISN